MAKSTKKSLILAVLQAGLGVAGVPTAADNAILVRNISAKPLEAEWASLDYVRPYFGNSKQLATTQHAELDFEVAMAGSGVPGAAPAWDPLMQACSFAATVTDGVSVAYNPISSDPARITLFYFLDGLLHKLTDALGSVSFDLTAKSVPTMKFHFVGVYNSVVDQAFPVGADFTKFVDPVAVNKLNVAAWSLHGYSGPLQALTMDIAATLTWNSRVTTEGVDFTDRQPTGSITMELPSIAAKDWFSTIRSGTTGALSITQGMTAGNIVQFDAPKVQLTAPTYSDDANVAMLGATLSLNPNVGDDELTITVK
jgi:hypothetical protein